MGPANIIFGFSQYIFQALQIAAIRCVSRRMSTWRHLLGHRQPHNLHSASQQLHWLRLQKMQCTLDIRCSRATVSRLCLSKAVVQAKRKKDVNSSSTQRRKHAR